MRLEQPPGNALDMLLRHSNHKVFGHFSILTGYNTKYPHMQEPSLLTHIHAAHHSANRNEDHLLLAPSAFWKWRARIGIQSVLDPRPKEQTVAPHHPQYLNAWSTTYLRQEGHGPSNSSSYLFLNLIPISTPHSEFQIFQVVSFTFVTVEIPRT